MDSAERNEVLEEAASDLGASRWRVFRRVTLPAVRPAFLAGAVPGQAATQSAPSCQAGTLSALRAAVLALALATAAALRESGLDWVVAPHRTDGGELDYFAYVPRNASAASPASWIRVPWIRSKRWKPTSLSRATASDSSSNRNASRRSPDAAASSANRCNANASPVGAPMS